MPIGCSASRQARGVHRQVPYGSFERFASASKSAPVLNLQCTCSIGCGWLASSLSQQKHVQDGWLAICIGTGAGLRTLMIPLQ